jgi:hypothetical protein
MKKIAIVLISFGILIAGCKKKETSPTPASSGGTTGGTTGGNGTTSYHALFEVNKSNFKFGTSFFPGMNCHAYLCTQPITNEIPSSSYINMGNVKLNSITFKNKSGSSNFYYNDTTYSIFPAPFAWEVTGSANFSAATFTSNTAFPVYPNYNSLPDSCSKAAGLTISLSGTSGCDFVEALIIGPGSSNFIFPKYIAGNSSSIVFSSSELSVLSTGSGGYLSLKFCKDNVQTISGKLVNTRSATSYFISSFKINP